jgi:hypothetical protein
MRNKTSLLGLSLLCSTLFISIVLLGLIALANSAWASGAGLDESHNLAKQSQNPVASLISLPFENNATFNNGKDDDFVNILNIKPVIPMGLTENWNWINRIIAPVIYDERDIPDHSAKFGIGDIIYQGFLSPAKSGKFIWGIGPQLNLPTGMERFTSDQWSLGPNGVILTMPGSWVIGLLAGNVWSIGGYNDAEDVNMFTAQYFINYNMKVGWYVTAAPVITANWEADDSDDKWTVPVGGGFGRVFKIGKQPVNLKLAVYYSVERPDNASDWNLQFQWNFLFPKKR